MTRILLTWELGAGLGHLGPLTQVGQRLAMGHGHEVWFCFKTRHPQLPDSVTGRVLQAPRVRADIKPLPVAETFAGILHNVGFGSREALSTSVRAWRDIYTLVKPDILVCDFSPFALLAAHGLPMAKVLFGISWHLPPPSTPLPPYRYTSGDNATSWEALETRLVEHANAVLAPLKATPLEHLGELYRDVDLTLLKTVSEFDHFDRPEPAIYVGAVPSLVKDASASSWPQPGKPRIFGYLKEFGSLPALLNALANGNFTVLIHASGKAYDTARYFQGPDFIVSHAPLPASSIAEADLVISHGGLSMTLDVTRSGQPMLLLPQHREQRINAANAVALGAALQLEIQQRPASTEDFGRAIETLLSDPGYRQAARRFASRYQHLDAERQVRWVAQRIADLGS